MKTKVLGFRVKDKDLLHSFLSYCEQHGLTNSELIEQSLRYFLSHHKEKTLTIVNNDVNKEYSEERYKTVRHEVDILFNHLECLECATETQ